jgi:hypothetical protein
MAYGETYSIFLYDLKRGFTYDDGGTWGIIPPYYWAVIPRPSSLEDDYHNYGDDWWHSITALKKGESGS